MINTSTDGVKDNVSYDRACSFAIRIVKLYKYLIKNREALPLANQVVRSGTSIGANIAEANGAISKADFFNKISIAYKACLETKYWLTLLLQTEAISQEAYQSIYADAEELSKVLFAILRSTRIESTIQV